VDSRLRGNDEVGYGNRVKKFYAPLATVLLLIAIIWWIAGGAGPSVETVATSSLEAMREQNRLSAFAANYSAVVTSEQNRFGLSARKTLIMQGLVRYEIDMAKLTADDVRWDAKNRTLQVSLPLIELAGPQIDLKSIQEYGEGGILRTLTDVDRSLDAANRSKGEAELLRQAKAPVPMGLAREAFRRAVAQNFAAPLRAAGIEAKVVAFHADEPREKVTTRWDYSTPLSEIVKH
jgi:Protein of unknown function (DUF4230)